MRSIGNAPWVGFNPTVPQQAGVICFVLGYLFGLPALRLDGVYLALASFALSVSVPPILKLSFVEQWTGGVQGMIIFPPDVPFALDLA